ncbi:type II secretion system protein [Peribacillus sp. NPDC097206]|uniref:type II secretion system protein n=1 Tax=unclassified Peribacillus TaxID=2675266 RepID=UPI00380FF747
MEENIFSKNQKGFTLVEVLASIAILGILTLTVMTFFTQSYDYTKRNQSKTVGINVARNVINYFDQLEFTELYKQYGIASLDKEGIKITLPDCNTRPSLYTTSCSEILQPTINNYKYDTEIILKQYIYYPDPLDKKTGYALNNLIQIEVKVVWEDKETLVEGLLKK